jgi:hypothetical protein
LDLGDARRFEADGATVNELARSAAQASALGQGVIGLAAKQLARLFAANQPRDLGTQRLIGQLGELEQRVERRVPATDDGHTFARMALPVGAKDVRDLWTVVGLDVFDIRKREIVRGDVVIRFALVLNIELPVDPEVSVIALGVN